MEELAIWNFSAQGWPMASPAAPGTPRSWRFDFTNRSLPAVHQWAGRYDIDSAEPVLGIATLWGKLLKITATATSMTAPIKVGNSRNDHGGAGHHHD